jgi:DNA-binding MarR family transcriptional regulator
MKAGAKSNRLRSQSGGSKGAREETLAKILAIIKSNPGIRPSELNRRLNVEQSDALRDVLIRRGLVRKVKDGQATHLYAK